MLFDNTANNFPREHHKHIKSSMFYAYTVKFEELSVAVLYTAESAPSSSKLSAEDCTTADSNRLGLVLHPVTLCG